MREVTPGSAIDEFHFEMWLGFLRFMLERDEVRAEFETETGTAFPKSGGSPLDRMIDEACGFDRATAQNDYMRAFARWVTPNYFGGPEDLSPAIEAKLAQGIETRSAIDAKRRGPKGESPVAESDAP